MISRVEKIILISLSGVIAVLVMALLFLSLAEESGIQTYSISVLVNDPSERFAKGVYQAALDYNVDIHMASNYSDSAQQIQYIQREWESGAEAVVIQPYNRADVESYLEASHIRMPVVTVKQRLYNTERAIHVGADDTMLGYELGGKIAAQAFRRKCLIICPAEAKPYMEERLKGIEQAFSQKGVVFDVIKVPSDEEDIAAYMPPVGRVTMAVLDESMLQAVCEQSTEGAMLFGVGYSSGARPYLENGRIECLIVYSEYDAGYISVREAVAEVSAQGGKAIQLGAYSIRPSNMYERPLVQILFPI